MKARLHQFNKLDQCPPFLAYALARSGTGSNLRRPTLEELVKQSGLPERTFIRVSQKLTWAAVKIETARAFLVACNVDPWVMKDQRKFLKAHADRLPHLSERQWRILNRRIDPNWKPD